ncbi:hypothetical protein NL676_013401 [Syzygium grande]|nr:hypothetical protein NL676_013401 [Syzygium grande]
MMHRILPHSLFSDHLRPFLDLAVAAKPPPAAAELDSSRLFESYGLCLDCLESLYSQLARKPYSVHVQRLRYVHCFESCGLYADAASDGFRLLESLRGIDFGGGGGRARGKGGLLPLVVKQASEDRGFAVLVVEMVVTIVKCVVMGQRSWMQMHHDKLRRALVTYLGNCAVFMVGDLSSFDGDFVRSFCTATLIEYGNSSMKEEIFKFARRICSMLMSLSEKRTSLIFDVLTCLLESSGHDGKIETGDTGADVSMTVSLILKLYALGLYILDAKVKPKDGGLRTSKVEEDGFLISKYRKDRDRYEEYSKALPAILVAAFTLSFVTKLNFQENMHLIDYAIASEWVQPQWLKFLLASLHNLSVILDRNKQVEGASKALKLSCRASWTYIMHNCQLLGQNPSELIGRLPLVKQWVKIQCKQHRHADAGIGILEDINVALKLWQNINNSDSCSLDEDDSMGALHSAIKLFKLRIGYFNLKNLEPQKYLTLLWESRRMSHALCFSPGFRIFSLSLLLLLYCKESFREITLEPYILEVIELRRQPLDLFQVPLSTRVVYLAGFLYYNLCERMILSGRLHELLSQSLEYNARWAPPLNLLEMELKRNICN